MQGLIISLIVKYIVGEIADLGVNIKWDELKATVKEKIQGAVHYAWLSDKLDELANALIDMAEKLCQDKTDLVPLLSNLAQKDLHAAEAAFKTMLCNVAPKEIAELLAA